MVSAAWNPRLTSLVHLLAWKVSDSSLALSVGQVTGLFYDWENRSAQIRIPKHKREVLTLTKNLDNTCEDYKRAMDQGAEGSYIGADLARYSGYCELAHET